MPKRYYCDFCDKSFADNPVARKNHMYGVFHQKNRKQHYDSFRDPEIILFEEVNKKPCKHFMQSGTCNFLENCRFSHLREGDIEKLKKQVLDMKEQKSNTLKKNENEFNEDKFQDFLKRLKKNEKSDSPSATIDDNDKCSSSGVKIPIYTVPSFLQNVQNLPPSLMPPPVDSFLNHEHVEWG